MHTLNSFFAWFSGGAVQYHKLSMCMMDDHLWIGITVALDLLIFAGYLLIAYHWSKNERSLPRSPARKALRMMRNIFIFCGICGYLFIPVKLFWPAWRLYDMFMLLLVFYTWRYALNAGNFQVIYTAIGRSHRLEQDLARSQDESKQKSFFLNAISHDLRTPLNGLVLHANLAELHATASDQAAVLHSLAEIKASVRLTADLLDGLLEYGRLETGAYKAEPSTFDLNDLIGDVVNTHELPASQKSLNLKNQIRNGIQITTDRLQLERILNNLVDNAIKFTESGSIQIDAKSTPKNLEIRVVDTGIGIAAEHQARLFEEFFQVHNHERDRTKGFGLGLAICVRLARQLGGELRVQSTLGKGSQFTLLLPAAVADVRPRTVTEPRPLESAETNREAAGVAG